METPKGKFTVAEAADAWIAMIEAPETKATPEQKAALIAKIRDAAPKTTGTLIGVGRVTLSADSKLCFSDACGAIKNIINGVTK